MGLLPLAVMPGSFYPADASALSRTHQLRRAVWLSFCTAPFMACSELQDLSPHEWKALLHWLDTSGLALYFLDRLLELGRCDQLPSSVRERLEQNLRDNTERTADMIAEAHAIHRAFLSEDLSYALVKGLALGQAAVTRPELRSQLDLDFLIAEASAPRALRLLEARGYRLHTISGHTWEFKSSDAGIPRSLWELYKPSRHRCVELHVENGRPRLLARAEVRSLRGVEMPVLSAVDSFLGQGIHAFKHIREGSVRTAHLLEFRRGVVNRSAGDRYAPFWQKLRLMADERPQAPLALGMVTYLLFRTSAECAPNELTGWTTDALPAAARHWIDLYGQRIVLAGFPGNKLYRLLDRELNPVNEPSLARGLLRTGLPQLRLPPRIEHALPGETPAARMRRARRQLSFILFRLRFHVLEGLRLAWESRRWSRQMTALAQESQGISRSCQETEEMADKTMTSL